MIDVNTRRAQCGPVSGCRRLAIAAGAWLGALLVAGPAVAQTTIFSDDFARADGPVSGWTVAQGTGSISGGQLAIGPTAGEVWIWAGSPASQVPINASDVAYEFDMEFLAPGTDPFVGRHAGFAFCGSTATNRYDASWSGYFVDWIDRTGDRGLRFTRVDNGVLSELVLGQGAGAPAQPPIVWRVEVGDTDIRVFGDGVEYITFPETTYRGGHFGVWSWAGGQQVAFDNINVTGDITGVAACFGWAPTRPLAGTDLLFDASCSAPAAGITAYEWDFGDGSTGNGKTVEHTYAFSDTYTVTLTVRNAAAESDTTTRSVVVVGSLLPFSDAFDRPAGPVDGWTGFFGDWTITGDEKLETITAGAEHWVWAGDPPGVIRGDFVAEFDMEFVSAAADGVGRHAGVMFFAGDPTIRWQTTGYFIDWIDRTTDRGLRFTRADGGGVLQEVIRGAIDSPPEPPLTWRIEVEGPNIRIFGDNILYIDLMDDTYREGHFGLWAYANNNDVLFDNIEIAADIAVELTPCMRLDPLYPLAGQSIAFDGTCSVAPEGVAITAYEWNFGDGTTANGPMVTHTYAVSDVYTVTLTVRAGGSSATTTQVLTAYGRALDYSDDFNRPDGPASQWETRTGDWSLLGGKLTTGPTTGETSIWAAGSPAVVTASNVTFSFEYSFLVPGDNPGVGRHGGFQFHCDRPTQRVGAGAYSGYFVDWIDRFDDQGLRLTRVDNGVLTLLDFGLGPQAGGVDPPQPPLLWRIVSDGDRIQVFGDDELYLDVVDGTHRGGFFGFWTWEAGQQVEIDNLTVDGTALTPCFTASPALKRAGTPVAFDAGCSQVFGGGATIASYSWDFGDGGSANGVTANHTFAVGDIYTVTLTVQDSLGNRRSLARAVTVADELLPFVDCFDRAAGPVDGWTPYAGEWLITDDQRLATTTAGAEHWLWAGDPPRAMAGDMVLEFEIEYLSQPQDGVGRHAGVMIYSQAPTIRWGTSGYTIWWIDRPTDFGIVIMRWDNGQLLALNAGTFAAVPQPPLVWRVEVTGPTMRVFGDGTMYVELDDDTYREGYLGLWAYANSQDVRFDNIRAGITTLPECGSTPEICTNGQDDDGDSQTDCDDADCASAPSCTGGLFHRGDSNNDGRHNISDPVNTLNVLFLGTGLISCQNAADSNDDGKVNISDPVNSLNVLFLGTGAVPPPLPPEALVPCGPDPTPDAPDLGCVSYTNC